MIPKSFLREMSVPLPGDIDHERWWAENVFTPLDLPFSAFLASLLVVFLDCDVRQGRGWVNYRLAAYTGARRTASRWPLYPLMRRFLVVVCDRIPQAMPGTTARLECGADGIGRVFWTNPAEHDVEPAVIAGDCDCDPTHYEGPHDDLGAAFYFEAEGVYPPGYYP